MYFYCVGFPSLSFSVIDWVYKGEIRHLYFGYSRPCTDAFLYSVFSAMEFIYNRENREILRGPKEKANIFRGRNAGFCCD